MTTATKNGKHDPSKNGRANAKNANRSHVSKLTRKVTLLEQFVSIGNELQEGCEVEDQGSGLSVAEAMGLLAEAAVELVALLGTDRLCKMARGRRGSRRQRAA